MEELGIRSLGPTPRSLVDLFRENADRGRNGDLEIVEEGAFVFDDKAYLTADLESLWRATFAPAIIRRPLIGLTLGINYAISGYDTWSYHLLNLLVHILASLCLFGVVRRTFLTSHLRHPYGGRAAALQPVVIEQPDRPGHHQQQEQDQREVHLALFLHLQDGEESLLRDLHAAHLLHPLLAFLLLLQQLALARDVTAVTLR